MRHLTSSSPLRTLTIAALIAAPAALSKSAFAQPAPAPPPAAPPPAPPAAAAPPPAAAAPPPAAAAPPPALAPAPEPAPPPPAAAPPPSAPVEPAAAEPLPSKLAVGKDGEGFFQPGFLLQMWFVVDHQNQPGPNWKSYIRSRRTELRVKGEIVPKVVAYNVMIDPSKLLSFTNRDVPVEDQQPAPTAPGTVAVPQPPADTSILQDAFVTGLSDYVDVSFGQFKNLVSWEGYNSASKIVMPERSLVSRTYGDRRDLGIKGEKKFEQFMYAVGVFSGQGPNQPDQNNQKNLSVRAEVYPIKNTLIGGLVYYAIGERDAPNTQDRAEGDLRLDLANVLFQAEYIHGWQMNAAGTDRISGQGAYAAFGYTFLEHVQPVLRFGFLDQDVDVPDSGTVVYEAGVNYFVKTGDRKDEMKLQLSYSYFDNAQNFTSAPGVSGNQNLAELILNAQVNF